MSSRSGSEGKTGAGARSVDDRARRGTDQLGPGDRRRRSWVEHEARFRGRACDTARPRGQIFAGDAEVDWNDAGHEGWRRFRAAGRHLLHGAWQGASGSSRHAPIWSRPRIRRSTLSRRADARKRGRKPCWMFWCRCKPYLPGAATPGRLRPRRHRPPIARRRCLRPAAGRPSSAKDPSVIWTRAPARRPS